MFQVYLNILETDYIKKKQEKAGDYYKLFQNVLCNNVKKVKNKLILDNNDGEKEVKKQVKKEVKEVKEVKEENKKEVIEKKDEKEKKKEKKKKKVKLNENNIIDKKPNDEYDKNIKILKNIKKKNTE